MKLKLTFFVVLIAVFSIGCSHNMRVTNMKDNFSPPLPPPKKPINIGIKSSDAADMEKGRYITAVVDALNQSGSFEKTIYPYSRSVHEGSVDVLVNLSVSPDYSGKGSNFFVNFPGFLIFAPAIWGYGYTADIETIANITFPEENVTRQLSVPAHYSFRQAEIDRTWTEIGWFEVGIIPLIGGIAFTQYDPDVTDDFITKIERNYGSKIANNIIETVFTNSPQQKVNLSSQK